MPELKASPRNRALGLLADALSGAKSAADTVQLPVVGGLGSLLFGDAPELVNDVAYYGPQALVRGGNAATGGLGTFAPDRRVLDAIGVAPMAPGAVRAAKTALNPMTYGRAFMEAQAPGVVSPITAWHGSPHKFRKFDSSKIGTGEGKQQQGIGSYIAESKQVGQKYADKEASKRGMESGYLYKLDLPDSLVEKMANHDLPFLSQPKNVKDAILKNFGQDEKNALKNYHGWENLDEAPFSAVLDAMEIVRGNNRSATSEMLRQSGVPGLRYLDGGSRSAGGGTSNFVVFPGEENKLTILERNGVPLGLLAD